MGVIWRVIKLTHFKQLLPYSHIPTLMIVAMLSLIHSVGNTWYKIFTDRKISLTDSVIEIYLGSIVIIKVSCWIFLIQITGQPPTQIKICPNLIVCRTIQILIHPNTPKIVTIIKVNIEHLTRFHYNNKAQIMVIFLFKYHPNR